MSLLDHDGLCPECGVAPCQCEADDDICTSCGADSLRQTDCGMVCTECGQLKEFA